MVFFKNYKMVSKSVFLFVVALLLTALISGCTKKVAVEDIELDKTNVNVMVGKSLQMQALVIPDDATDKTLTWTSSDDKVATVVNGLITGIKIGTAKITVSSGKITKNIDVSVVAAEHKVTFNTDGGTVFPEQIVADGGKATYPGAPVKEGHKFGGWFKKDLTTEFDFNVAITEAQEIVAKWTVNKYRVVFKVDNVTYKEEQVEYNSKVTKPANPIKEGYNFAGWFNGEFEYNLNTPIKETLELNAKFSPKNNTVYKVNHYKFNTNTNDFVLIDTEELTGTTGATVVAFPKTFEGYMTEQEKYEGVILADGSLEIDIKYVLWSFSYEYVLNGGNFTYQTRAEMVTDFLNDYNKAMGKTDTLEAIAGYGNWSPIDFHKMFFMEGYREKWLWMADYLGQNGSSTNKKSASDILVTKTESEYTGKNANHIYAFTYEVRAFILGIKYTKNANWMSSDYSDFGLANGFWDTFVKYREEIKFTNLIEEQTLKTSSYKEGYTFAGWYLNSDFSGEPVTTVRSSTKVYAKWDIKDPVTAIEILNPVAVLDKFATHQLQIKILPDNAFNKQVVYSTSDDKVLQVSDTGLVKAVNAGKATISVKSVVTGVTATVEITVSPQDDITIKYSKDFDGTLKLNKEVTLTLAGVGKLTGSSFAYTSKDTNILTVDTNGVVKGVGLGVGTIDIGLANDPKVLLTITINVIEEPTTSKIDQLIALLTSANNAVVDSVNASLYYDNYSAFQQYYDSVYGSVNLFLFDTLAIDSTTYLIDPTQQTNKHSGLKTSTEFIVVHDTANISGGLTNHGSYWKQEGHTTSIHFTVGDGGVVQSLDTKYVAHHAGDGTGTKFSWTDTNIPSNNNKEPKISINATGNFTFNGVDSKVAAPKGKNGEILDDSYFTILGPTWTIGTNGNYYIGTHAFDTSQNSRGVIASRGGNNNSVGIEMCVNTNGNIYDTWQRTAKLVSKLMVDNNLDLNRVIQHNTITGKNCPQSLIMSNYWDTFMKMVEIEHIIRTQYGNAKISMLSNNPTLVNNKGLVIGEPLLTTSVSYTITVEIDGVSKSITLSSVIPGTSSWSQLNGMFSTK